MDKNDVFNLMKDHYLKHGKLMDPHQFENVFIGHITTSEAINGLIMFDRFLDFFRYENKGDLDEFRKNASNAKRVR